MKKANKKYEAVDITLKENGLKLTDARREILLTLINAGTPLTTEDLSKRISKHINTTTIYRTLENFVNKKIIYQTDFRDSKSYFEFQKNHHHHISCTICKKKEEVRICIDKILKKQIRPKNFESVDSHVLEFFGVCNKCRNK